METNKKYKNKTPIFIFIFIFFCNYQQSIHAQTFQQKKVFILTGETSGDHIGAWYLEKLKHQNPSLECEAIGGPALKSKGAHLYSNYASLTLGFVGLFTFLWHLPERWKLNNQIAQHILAHNFTDVVLVDCPLTNLPLARRLKKENPHLTITYIAPPELWIWGKWWIDSLLKSYCDHIIVIYPFEVEWYYKQGLNVEWHGYPHFEKIKPYFNTPLTKENKIALLPGSRESEIRTTLPLFAKVAQKLHKNHPETNFIMPVASSFSQEKMHTLLKEHNIDHLIRLINDESEEKHRELRSCCLAITKPGTITLILGLHQVPAVIAYRVPWLTYLFARMVIQVPFIGLPNLFLNKEIYKELIQSECTEETIIKEAEKLYEAFIHNKQSYQETVNELGKLKDMVSDQNIILAQAIPKPSAVLNQA